jgi:hypothetical protein
VIFTELEISSSLNLEVSHVRARSHSLEVLKKVRTKSIIAHPHHCKCLCWKKTIKKWACHAKTWGIVLPLVYGKLDLRLKFTRILSKYNSYTSTVVHTYGPSHLVVLGRRITQAQEFENSLDNIATLCLKTSKQKVQFKLLMLIRLIWASSSVKWRQCYIYSCWNNTIPSPLEPLLNVNSPPQFGKKRRDLSTQNKLGRLVLHSIKYL